MIRLGFFSYGWENKIKQPMWRSTESWEDSGSPGSQGNSHTSRCLGPLHQRSKHSQGTATASTQLSDQYGRAGS